MSAHPDLDPCHPGSHPHVDRRNWRPAETVEAYFTKCREGLEDFSERRLALLLGMSRVQLWRCEMMAGIPRGPFECLVRLPGGVSSRSLTAVDAALSGNSPRQENEQCPCCGHVLRVRGRWPEAMQGEIDAWIGEQTGEVAAP